MPTQIAKAIRFAMDAHGDSLDRGGDLAILHPMAVMLAVKEYGVAAMTVAILHDTVEDTSVTHEKIRYVFGPEIGDAVKAISRYEGEQYFEYIKRAKANDLARVVKLADLAHNSSPARLAKLPETERGITKRYEKARAMLLDPRPMETEHDRALNRIFN
jgi:(p)ppGpp synthase/HD superfamily hydrolase